MPLSDRERKVLWAGAGNRCSMCRAELAQVGSSGSVALIGEECHIVGPRQGGPRGALGPGVHPDLDGYGNSILLGAVDHSRIDQLPDEFPVDALIALKAAHEVWGLPGRLGPLSTGRGRGEARVAAGCASWPNVYARLARPNQMPERPDAHDSLGR